ncbi:dipeptidase [candidate division KSB1 bacterium]
MFLKRFVVLFVILVLQFFFACSMGVDIEGMTEEEFLAYAMKVHENAITIDTHVDIPGGQYATAEMDPGSEEYTRKCSLPKMEKGGLDGVFLAVYVGQRDDFTPEGYERVYTQAMDKFDAIHRLAEAMYPERCEIAYTPDDVIRIAATGKRVILIGIENGYTIGEDLSLVQKYYDLGTRYITLCHSGHNQICDSSGGRGEPKNNGISDFGKQVVAEMNRLGILADVSHIGEKSYWDLIEISKAPIIASHSGCRALRDNGRNLDDEQLKALAENGGVIQIVALGNYLGGPAPERREAITALAEEVGMPRGRGGRGGRGGDQQEVTVTEEMQKQYDEGMKAIDEQYPNVEVNLQTYVDHIDHAVKIAGIDHVGIGTDFDGGGGIPGFNDHSESMNVTIELLKRGYSEEEINKIWGGNLLRAWRDAQKVAESMK